MKICWDNLEKLKYNPKTEKWYKKKNVYIYMDSCKECGEPYLKRIDNKGNFCNRLCINKKQNHPNWKGNKHNKFSYTYRSWEAMKQRCLNPNNVKYDLYGGKGIIVCERWMKFENFLADMGERPEGTTIDRIDGTKGYYKENCRWSTVEIQNRNQKNNKLNENKVKEIKKLLEKKDLTQQQIADIYNISLSTISKIKLNKTWNNRVSSTNP